MTRALRLLLPIVALAMNASLGVSVGADLAADPAADPAPTPAFSDAPVPLDDQAVDAARDQLDAVRADPRFHRWMRRAGANPDTREPGDAGLRETPGSAFLRNVTETIGDFFRWLFRRTPSNSSPSPSTGASSAPPFRWDTLLQPLGWAVLIAAVAGLLYAVWVHRHGMRRRSTAPVTREQLDAALVKGDALAADAPAWSRHARDLVAQGDLRLAYRAAYLALLTGLHRAGRIHYRRQRTNFTYVNGYRGPREQQSRFAQLTDAFDECWYGHQTPDADGFATLEQETGRLLHDAELSLNEDTA